MRKSILCAVGFAVIAALVCVVCNNDSVDEDKKGAAASFLDRFIDTDVAYYGLTVGINPAGGGAVSREPNETRYKAGDSVKVTATVSDGYRFTGWTGASNDISPSVIIIMNSDLTLTANFIPIIITYYTLDVNTLPVGSGVVSREPNETRYKEGDAVRVTAAVRDGYKFTGWSGASNDTSASVIITMNSDLTLTANFIPINSTYYTLDVSTLPVGYGSVSRDPNRTGYAPGESVMVTASANPGYAFAGWSGASNNTTDTVTIIMNRDLTLTANFQVGAYTLTLAANPTGGGSVSREPDKKTYSYEDTVTVTATVAPYYRFTGWSGASTDTADVVKIIMNDSKALTANFVLLQYTLTTNVSNSGRGVVSPSHPNGALYSHGDEVTVRAAASAGYRFTGWSGASTDTISPVTITMDSGKTLTANFIRQYTITFDANEGSGATPTAITVDSGSVITLPGGSGLTRDTCVFGGWNTDPSGTGTDYNAGASYTPVRNTTLYAKYTTYTITFDANGGIVSPASVTTSGRLASLPTPTRDNHIFNGWYLSGLEVTTNTVFKFDITIYAQWIPIYTISFDANGGTVTPTSGTTGADRKLDSLPTPMTRTGYTFNGWYTMSTGGTRVTTSRVFNEDVTIYAQWTLITYKVTFDANGGSVTPESATTGDGWKLASLPTPKRNGDNFEGWFTASTSGTSVTTSTVFTSNTTIYAQWTPYVYTGRTVTIGTQTWMAENLNRETTNSKCYRNSADSCAKYGRLYNWSDALTACPVGWHLSTDDEWTTLVSYVEQQSGCSSCVCKMLKSTSGWYDYYSYNGTDDFEFSALPGGYGSDFSAAGRIGYWWSATEDDAYLAWYWAMVEDVYRYSTYKTEMFSVRCVQD